MPGPVVPVGDAPVGDAPVGDTVTGEVGEEADEGAGAVSGRGVEVPGAVVELDVAVGPGPDKGVDVPRLADPPTAVPGCPP